MTDTPSCFVRFSPTLSHVPRPALAAVPCRLGGVRCHPNENFPKKSGVELCDHRERQVQAQRKVS